MQTTETTPTGLPCDAWDSCPNPDHAHPYVTHSTIVDPAGLEQPAVVRRTGDGLAIEQADGAAVDLGVEQARAVGAALVELADRLTPAGPGSQAVLTSAARELGITLAELACEAGVDDVDRLTRRDVHALARALGQRLA